jgi:pimeloyl-ACP methyl ester carboxylesterase
MARQAVLLIHGIGEQRPMETLRRFVDAVWIRDTKIQNAFAVANAGAAIFSKPDTVSDNYELRCLSTPQNTARSTTDFYEFYWQHLMEGTTYGHVVMWARTLLFRRPLTVPKQLRAPYWLLWGCLVLSLTLAIVAAASGARSDRAPMPWWVSLILSAAIVPAAGLVVKSIVGDAARYLHAAPKNVQCRQTIRRAGVAALKALHARGYDRIIVVGHSLGSVIGFDILSQFWAAHRLDPIPATGTMACLDALETLAVEGTSDADTIQAAQRAYFAEFVLNGTPWRVTDFVTLGSPLAHADILLARNAADLQVKQRQREVPRCPPELETFVQQKVTGRRFSFPIGTGADPFRVPHQGACFALTRWTNLYFPNRMIVVGDLVGGELAPLFGSGVRDVKVTTRQRRGLLSHTLYWTSRDADAPHVQELRDALDLVDSRSGAVTRKTSATAPPR